MTTWLKDYAPTIGALTGAVVAVVAILQIAVVGPMNQRFDELRSDMNQRLGEVNQRFDGLRTDMNQRFADLRADMNARFDAQDKYMNARFDTVDQRLDRLENGVSELRSL